MPESKKYLSKIKISKKDAEEYLCDSDCVWGYFTLISHDESSYKELFDKFREWLNKFPDENIRKLEKELKGRLVKKYREKR